MSEAATLTPDRITSVINRLEGGDAVHLDLPGGGRLHIDRPQPFLCLYRQPEGRPDPGTDTLPLSQASCLVVAGENTRDPSLLQLVEGISRVLKDAFGAAIILEICTSDEPLENAVRASGPEHPVFRLVAPASNTPHATLQTLQSAIAAADWPCPAPVVEVQYSDHWHPAGATDLFSTGEEAPGQITYLGLEISPFFRDHETHDVFPEILRDMTFSLGHVLKQAFYTFSHKHATYRPIHFHELGQADLTDSVREVDKGLANLADRFDVLLQVTPVNTGRAWNDFHQSHFDRKPEFLYRPMQHDPGRLKQELYQIRLHEIEDPALHHIFSERRDELDRQITLMTDRGHPRFLHGSMQIFGSVDDELLGMARDILRHTPPHSRYALSHETLDADDFAVLAQSEIDHYRELSPLFTATVQVRDDIPGIMVSKGHLLIGREARIAPSRVMATLHHEVGTHIVTYYNGLTQPFRQLHVGLAGYEELQEGLAVLSEFLVGGLSRSRLRQLAGRVVAVHSVTGGAGFVDTFRMLVDQYDFSENLAFMMSMRTHRGGGYVKDMIYLRGLKNVLDWLQTAGDLEVLFVGKFALGHVDIMEELIWRKILTADVVLPRYLQDPDAQRRLEEIKSGLSIVDMMAGGIA